MKIYKVKPEVGFYGLLDDLTGAALEAGYHHGMRPDREALCALKSAFIKVLKRDLNRNGTIEIWEKAPENGNVAANMLE